jgi:hypothetical protein
MTESEPQIVTMAVLGDGRNVKEADWLGIPVLGSPYETEVDVNANPDAPQSQRYRHRTVSYTGEPIPDWKSGPPPE